MVSFLSKSLNNQVWFQYNQAEIIRTKWNCTHSLTLYSSYGVQGCRRPEAYARGLVARGRTHILDGVPSIAEHKSSHTTSNMEMPINLILVMSLDSLGTKRKPT